MRLTALTVSALLLLLGGCASSSNNDQQFVKPNQLMGGEIESRIANIPLQHREDLLQNMLWLSQQGEQAIGALLQGMQHQEPKVRSSCAWVLGRIGDRRAASHLRPYLRDSNETVRLEVARSLVSLGDMEAVPELVGGLDSNKKEVRYLCHEALKGATGRDFGFDHLSEDVGQRHLAVLGWRQWWSEYAKDPYFAQNYAREHNLTNQPAAPMGETNRGTPDPLAPRQQPQESQTTDPEAQDPARQNQSSTGSTGTNTPAQISATQTNGQTATTQSPTDTQSTSNSTNQNTTTPTSTTTNQSTKLPATTGKPAKGQGTTGQTQSTSGSESPTQQPKPSSTGTGQPNSTTTNGSRNG